jgi:hypothetical protein
MVPAPPVPSSPASGAGVTTIEVGGGVGVAALVALAVFFKRRRGGGGGGGGGGGNEPLLPFPPAAPAPPAPPPPPAAAAANDRFIADGHFIRLGLAQDATLGLKRHLGIDDDTQARFLQQPMAAIEGEFANAPNAEDRDNFVAVRDGDFVGNNRKALDALLAHPHARQSRLQRHHVMALRLYTTSSHSCINPPMREDPPTRPHPFAATTMFLADGIRLLRTVHANGDAPLQQRVFWRGVADLGLDQLFFERGGTEYACSSTSADKGVAFGFAGVDCPLLLKFVVPNVLQLGADVSFLSAYPTEQEVLYPPLTYLRPLGPAVKERYHGTTVLVAEVEPAIGAD